MMAIDKQGYFLSPAVDRKFWSILGLSILLHATLFAVTSWQRQHVPVALPPIWPPSACSMSPHPNLLPQQPRYRRRQPFPRRPGRPLPAQSAPWHRV
jgi:hypothetical protein